MADSGNTLHLGQVIKETGDFGNFQILMIIYEACSGTIETIATLSK